MDTVHRILAAAERLFAERGFAGTRTADIARAAQVTERTLFKHFSDKQTLLHQVTRPAMLAVAAAVAPQEADAPFDAWFANVLRERVAAAQAAPHALRVVLIELLTSPEARRYFAPLW